MTTLAPRGPERRSGLERRTVDLRPRIRDEHEEVLDRLDSTDRLLSTMRDSLIHTLTKVQLHREALNASSAERGGVHREEIKC